MTVVANKTTNSEKAIYFLSLISCSIKKLKSHIFFICKNFMVSDFQFYGGKKICARILGVGGAGGRWGVWHPSAHPFPKAMFL